MKDSRCGTRFKFRVGDKRRISNFRVGDKLRMSYSGVR